jgi:hypothetical protein
LEGELPGTSKRELQDNHMRPKVICLRDKGDFEMFKVPIPDSLDVRYYPSHNEGEIAKAVSDGDFILASSLFPPITAKIISGAASLKLIQLCGSGYDTEVVVDEDIDPSNLRQVVWAISTRCDPERSIQILPWQGTSSNDTTVSPAEKRKWQVPPKPLYSSRAVIDACQPLEWKNEWYPVAKISPELRAGLLEKWHELFQDIGRRK